MFIDEDEGRKKYEPWKFLFIKKIILACKSNKAT